MTGEDRSSTKAFYVVAVIGLVGTIGAAIINVLGNSTNNTPPASTESVPPHVRVNRESAAPPIPQQPRLPPHSPKTKNTDKNSADEPTREDGPIQPVFDIPQPSSIKTRKDQTFAMELKDEDTAINPAGAIPSSGAIKKETDSNFGTAFK